MVESPPLLKTKLYIPPTRPKLVPRQHLVERLNAGLYRKLTLASAPAGFGKTTLLSVWARGGGGVTPPLSVAWVSLDAGDNDPARFMAHFVAALQEIPSLSEIDFSESALAALQSSRVASADVSAIETVLATLINDVVAAGSERFALVLDDYHLIKTQSIHDAITFLLDHLPPQMHLVVATRADPPLPLARLRARGQLTELRLADLRFTPDEAITFIKQVMDLALSTDDMKALHARTEGWIAGLQMAAVSLQGREDVAGFVQAFTGSDRYILDYLVEEVLQRQSEDVQAFLLQTSILDRLSGPLCDAVLGKAADWELEAADHTRSPISGLRSQALLEFLEASNLFIVPLDNERCWYRYHRLFADLLRKRLHQAQPSLVPTLHRRASVWYEHNALMDAAIEHALAAEAFARGADLITQVAETTLMRSEVATLLGWVKRIPDELVQARPTLALFHAWALLLSGHSLEIVESRLQGLDKHEAPITGAVTALRARIAALRGQMSRAAELSLQALSRLPEDDSFLRGVTFWNLGISYWAEGDATGSSQALEEAARVSCETGNVMVAAAALCRLAGLRIVRGQLHEAKDLYQRALALATDEQGQRLPAAGEALIGLGELYREWNDLETAVRHLTEGIELSRQSGEMGALGGYFSLARIKQAQGDTGGAHALVQRARQVATKSDATQVDDLTVDLCQARLWIAQGDLEATERWAERRGLAPNQAKGPISSIGPTEQRAEDDEIIDRHLRKYEHMLLARLLLAQSRPGEALKLLEQVSLQAKRPERTRLMLEIEILRALAFQAQDDVTRSMDALTRAVSIAEPGGYVRVFLDEGEPMIQLLRRAAARGIAPDYVGKLLMALGDVIEDLPSARRPPPPTWAKIEELVEPLSERELEVLRLLPTHLSSTEIAEQLYISANTVRFHIKNIYSKLGVHRRADAVRRAKEMGLL